MKELMLMLILVMLGVIGVSALSTISLVPTVAPAVNSACSSMDWLDKERCTVVVSEKGESRRIEQEQREMCKNYGGRENTTSLVNGMIQHCVIGDIRLSHRFSRIGALLCQYNHR